MADMQQFVEDPTVKAVIRSKAASLGGNPLFSRDDPEDIQQFLWHQILKRADAFDPERGTMSGFAATVADSEIGMEIRRRSRIKRVGDYTAISLEGTFIECDGDLTTLDRVIAEADLGRLGQRAAPSPLEQVDNRDGIEYVMERVGPGVEALLKRASDVGKSQTARERSRELGFRVSRDHITKIQTASRPIFEDAGFSQE